jgi:hypothetical protein
MAAAAAPAITREQLLLFVKQQKAQIAKLTEENAALKLTASAAGAA